MHSDLHRSEYWPKLSANLCTQGKGEYSKNRQDMYEILQLILLSDLTLGSEYACAVLYNFELDTPEDVWNRIDLFLSENKSEGE